MTSDSDSPTPLTRPETLPLLDHHGELEKGIRGLKGHPRHAAINAMHCLRRGWLIAPIDPEMAAFRAITAEEEAATALILALKQQRYPGADQLNHRNHVHKSGLKPFLRAIEHLMAETKFPSPEVRLNGKAQPPRIDIRIPLKTFGSPDDLFATPDEPLNGVIRQGRTGETTQTVLTFETQLQNLADQRGVAGIFALMQQEANLRNRVLYAGSGGIAEVGNVDAELLQRRRIVTVLLSLTIIVLQTKAHQLLVVQALEAYIRALNALPRDPFDYDAAIGDPPEWSITADLRDENAPVVVLRRRVD